MRNVLSGVLAAGLLTTACNTDHKKPPVSDIPLSTTQLDAVTSAIREQYQAIIHSYSPGESVTLRLNDQSAALTITVQNQKIIMAQLVPRNPYPNDPSDVKAPYIDLNGDGKLEVMPAHSYNGQTYYNSPLTYGNYLAFLTRFGLPQEVICEDKPATKKQNKAPKNNLGQNLIPPTPELFSRIAQ